MEGSPKVVYAAKNVQQAYMLKNALEEAGIHAVVTNATLESGSGVDYVGWNTLARVAVDESDYEVARKIALDYDRMGAETAQQYVQEEYAQQDDDWSQVLHEWPRCPQCNAERITRCPVCKTTGSDFPEADTEYVWGMGLKEISGNEEGQTSSPCQCGTQGTCSTQQDAPSSEAELVDQPESMVLMCPTCDEPFIPDFPKECAMCGHIFPDGLEVELHHGLPEQIDNRAIALMVGMAAGLIALLGYFVWLMR